jgi:cytochrome c oxidase subunit 3
MVLAVDAGHQMNKNKVVTYMALTILGGLIFLGSQAWEWSNFISGEYGAVKTKSGKVIQFVDSEGHRIALDEFATIAPKDRTAHLNKNGVWYESESSYNPLTIEDVKRGFAANESLRVRTTQITEEGEKEILTREESLLKLNTSGIGVIQGANLTENEYGAPLFGGFFFFITGFHGFHVFSGVLILIIIFFNVLLGTYEKRGSYEMVEKVGLYWHFVDLVWVFVFTFFYLV